MLMMKEISLSLTEILSVLAAIGGVISVWIATSIKIAKLETMVQIKFAAIEAMVSGNMKENSDAIKEMIKNNREEHRDIMHDVKNIRQTIMSMALQKTMNEGEGA